MKTFGILSETPYVLHKCGWRISRVFWLTQYSTNIPSGGWAHCLRNVNNLRMFYVVRIWLTGSDFLRGCVTTQCLSGSRIIFSASGLSCPTPSLPWNLRCSRWNWIDGRLCDALCTCCVVRMSLREWRWVQTYRSFNYIFSFTLYYCSYPPVCRS